MPRSRLVSRSALVALAVALVTAPSGVRASTTPDSDAALLLDQGEQQQKAGQLATALELYRAALLLAPNNAEAHRLAASALISLHRCPEAIAQLQAYLDLAGAAAKRTPAYAQAVVSLARCLEEAQATIQLVPSASARCTVDQSPAAPASPSAPASFAVVPGTHVASCETAAGLPVTQSVTVGARESKRIALSLGPQAAAASVSPLPPVAEATLPPPPIPTPPSIPAPPPITAPAGSLAPRPSLPAPPVVPSPAVATPPLSATPSSVAAGADSTKPTSPAPPSGALRPPGAAATGEIRIHAQGEGWTCRVDGGAPVAFEAAGRAIVPVAPGQHVVDCDRPGSQRLEARLSLSATEERVVEVKPFPLAPAAAPPGSGSAPAHMATRGAPTSKPASAPVRPPSLKVRRWEMRLALGFGPSLGVFGLGLGGRYGPFELMLGTGLDPFAVSGTYYFRPGRSGFYLSAGYVRVGTGLLAPVHETSENGFWASGGYDVRAEPHLAFRIGVGAGYDTSGLGTGPFVLDFSAAYLP